MPNLKPFLVTDYEQFIEEAARCHIDREFYAFKYTENDGTSPVFIDTKPKLVCKPKAILRVPNADTNHCISCGAGVNVATKGWCEMDSGALVSTYAAEASKLWVVKFRKLWMVKFRRRDIAAIPRPKGTLVNNMSFKFRLYRCEVVKRVKWF